MPYVLKTALTKVKDKPFNFTLIVGTQKQVLLVTPKPAGKSLLDEAKTTSVKGEREGKGIVKKINEKYIFCSKTVTGTLRTGIKLAMNNNNCKSVDWDLQALGANESDEVMTEDADEAQGEVNPVPTTTLASNLRPTQPAQNQPIPPQRPTSPLPGSLSKPPQPQPPPVMKPSGPVPQSLNPLQRPPPPLQRPSPIPQTTQVKPTGPVPNLPPPPQMGQVRPSGPMPNLPPPPSPLTQVKPLVQPVQGGPPSPKKAFDDRFAHLGPDYQKARAIASNKPEMEALFQEAGKMALAKNWDAANGALDKLETLIAAALNPKAPEKKDSAESAPPQDQPKMDPRMARIVASEQDKFVSRSKAPLEKQLDGLKVHLKAMEEAKADPVELKKFQTAVAQAKQKLSALKAADDLTASQREIDDLEKALVAARRKATEQEFKQSQAAEEKTVYDHVMAPVGSTRKFAFQPGDADRYEKEMGKFTGNFEKGASAEWAKPPKPTKEEAALEAQEKKKLKDAQSVLAAKDKELKKSKSKESAMDQLAGKPETKAEWQTLRKAQANSGLSEALAPLNKEFQKTLGALKKLEDAKGKADPQAVAALQKQAEDLAAAIQGAFDEARKKILDGGFADNPSQLGESDKELFDAVDNPEGMRQLQVCQSIALEAKMRDVSLKPVLDAMKKVEADKNNRTNIEALIKECDQFLKPLNSKEGLNATRSRELQKKEDNARFILKYARILLLGLESDKLGPPPWNDETKRAKASELETQLFFEENPLKQRARQEGSTASGTWFVERIPKDKEGKRVTKGSGREEGGRNDVYIFKPIDAEPDLQREIGKGWTKGGGAPREVMSKTASDAIQKATGLNVGVCPTSLVALDSDKLPDATGDFSTDAKRSGALQEMSQCLGSFDDFNKPSRPANFDKLSAQQKKKIEDDEKAKKAFLATVPGEDYGKLVVFDLMTLQMDRHGGNILMNKDSDGKARMTPIDHGLSMPGKDAYASTAPRMLASEGPGTSGKNVLMTMPQADAMLDEKVVKSLELIDPDEIEREMKASYSKMRATHPSTDGMFNENKQTGEIENFTIIKRSAMFLKKAASKLTAAELFGVYGGVKPKGGGKLPDPEFLAIVQAKDDKEVNNLIDTIIAKVISNRPA